MPDRTPITTARLILRPPRDEDALAIFQRFASDPEVTRFVGWPRHVDLEDTTAFLALAHSEWRRWPVGPLLIESRADGRLLGSTGLAFETAYRASTGYVLARDAWGNGFAQEALAAVTARAAALGVRRLHALCHPDHAASIRVLERCGFELEGTLRRYWSFPNLGDHDPQDVCCYSRSW